MFENNKILVVIPARGGSKGIPRKNIRLLNQKPLISYVIKMVKDSKYVDDFVVSTEDSEIATISKKFGADVIKRPDELSADDIPLDEVIYDAVRQTNTEYDIIITVQPTSPLLKTETLDVAIEKFRDSSIDSVISVIDDRHLSWGFNDNHYFPLYEKRLNRQYLPKNFRETGSILATRNAFISKNNRLGKNIDLIEVPKDESVDIDNYEDWWVAENYLNKKKIAIIVNAYDEIGTGHIYRCISLASRLLFHEVVFVLNENHKLGVDIVKSFNYPYKLYDDNLLDVLDEINPEIVINDILNTKKEYISKLKEKNYFIVNFEDLGTGIEEANLVFNALYEKPLKLENVYTGHDYYILKDEFYFQESKTITKDVDNVLVTFGGTDPNNLTEIVLNSLNGFNGNINVILGSGYPNKEKIIETYARYDNIAINKNVKSMSEHMFNADIIFSSAGRTMYEIASIGVPCICICQNERELNHTFANSDNGFINLGIANDVNETIIKKEFDKLKDNFKLRKEMNQKMLKNDLKHGFENVWSKIEKEYRKIINDNFWWITIFNSWNWC